MGRPFPGVRELFDALKARQYRLGITTTCTGDELRSYEEKMRVLALANVVTCGEDIRKGKPHPELFYQTLREFGSLEPSRVLAAGDTPFGAMAAKSLGIRALGVLTGVFSSEDLMSAGCEAIIAEVKDVCQYLNR
jgi:phosphoglycolate phosphatase-like HAD superfamily hydrolase